ncbi:SPOR domain-containing protein [Novosphingobium sp.]|uniref:SPOR domain-containing protein n=1 Tax=Novosphingobium sp. TaxID=1874826 RepID=UPI00334033A8
MHADEHDAASHDGAGHDETVHAPSLDLGEDERLPWLESADDVEDERTGGGSGRLIGLAAAALLLLGTLVGGVYWFTHRGGSSRPADGSLIEASKDPYKVAPADPGGKTFAGTGDTSFKVSQGEHPEASLGTGAPAAASPAATPSPPAAGSSATATPAAKPAAHDAPHAVAAAKPAAASPAPAGGGVAVQVGAFSTNALAESAWTHLVAAHDVLNGQGHRVVEGKADIGTVYRLQALASDTSAANSLCNRLQADGVKCQVKH